MAKRGKQQMGRDTPELGIPKRSEALSATTRDWLLTRLGRDPSSPLVPISAIERALQPHGIDVLANADSLPTPEEMLAHARNTLFPAARMRALQRFVARARDAHRAAEQHTEAATAEQVGLLLRNESTAYPVLREVLSISLERPHGIPKLDKVLRHIQHTSWPARSLDELSGYDHILRRLPLRIPPVDLLDALREIVGLRPKPKRAPTNPAQLPLLRPDTFPSVAPEGQVRLSPAARDALAEAVDGLVATHNLDPEARGYARALSGLLHGAPAPKTALEALIRTSARQLNSNCSAAELKRIEAILTRGRNPQSTLLAYGDYLARARRPGEAIRAYQAARLQAGTTGRRRIDARIKAHMKRINAGDSARTRRRPDPDQLIFAFEGAKAPPTPSSE